MFLKSKLLYLHVETPLHAGAGSGLGAIDLPIQRERATGYPLMQASGLKGALRAAVRESISDPGDEIEAVFGPEPKPGSENMHAGAFSPADARILLFPVRSLKGVFAWVTSVNVLQRWKRDVKDIVGDDALSDLPNAPQSTDDKDYCYACPGVRMSDGRVVLEEYVFHSEETETPSGLAKKLSEWIFSDHLGPYWTQLLQSNLVILPDDAFKDFVMYATEVITRTRLDPDTKTVVKGALWTEEHLPMDTVLYSPIRATRIRMVKNEIPEYFNGGAEKQAEAVLTWLVKKVGKKIQMGGDATVGRGLVSLNWQG